MPQADHDGGAYAAALEATVPVQDTIDSNGRAGVVMAQGMLVGGKTNLLWDINGPVSLL